MGNNKAARSCNINLGNGKEIVFKRERDIKDIDWEREEPFPEMKATDNKKEETWKKPKKREKAKSGPMKLDTFGRCFFFIFFLSTLSFEH